MQETKRKMLRQKKQSTKFYGENSVEEKEVPETDGSTYLDFKVVTEINKKKNSKEGGYGKIEFIPTVELKKEDMDRDPIQLINELQKVYSDYGAVKLQTPPQWNPPFSFKYSQRLISTRIQPLHYLKQGKPFKQKQNSYDIRGFTDFAKDFDCRYRFKSSPKGSNLQLKHEQEYWQIVNSDPASEKGKILKTRVEYAADLPVNKFGSGFPIHTGMKNIDQHFDYANNLFNLNKIYESQNSLTNFTKLRDESISGITLPWVYMGMKFSTFCWHVEDLGLNSINYSHKGAIKTWYVVPENYKKKFDEYVQKKTGQSNLLNRITFMLDPLELIQNGITVYKAYQSPGQYICTFFNAYHGGFSQGFNVGEAVNLISMKSIGEIKKQMDTSKKPEVLSYQWLIHENVQRNQFKGKDKKQMKARYNQMIKSEFETLKELCKKYSITNGQEILMDKKYFKNTCSKCKNYQYLSSLKCGSCHKNYCFKDVIQCCKGHFILQYRELRKERQPLLSLLDDQ